MSTVNKIVSLAKQLYPTGRAFRFPKGGMMEAVHRGLAISEAAAYEDALTVLYSILPDTDNFTAEDAAQWERRLGLAESSAGIDDRRLAIKRKMNHPGTIKTRQNYRYLESQLRAAGFDVYVYENRFDDGMGGFTVKTPAQILGSIPANATVHASTVYHGTKQHGSLYGNLIVNYIDRKKDATFVIGSNYRSTFYISGSTVDTFAEVPAEREAEFRQLILTLKPVQMIGFLFVNYV